MVELLVEQDINLPAGHKGILSCDDGSTMPGVLFVVPDEESPDGCRIREMWVSERQFRVIKRRVVDPSGFIDKDYII